MKHINTFEKHNILNENDETCWSIKEKYPIEVTAKLSRSKEYYVIKAQPMTVSNMLWKTLGNNLTQDILDKRARNSYLWDDEGKIGNDVYYSNYNYSNGECSWRASSKDDVINWGKQYSDIVKIKFI